MENSALFNQIIAKLRTTSELSDVLDVLEKLINTSFSPTAIEEQKKYFPNLPREVSNLLMTAFVKNDLTAQTQIATKRQINTLIDQLRKCKVVKLTIAFQADDSTISLFSDWIKKNVKPDLLIDLQFDKSIVGGAQIIAGGIYKDYSVRKNLSSKFQIQRDEIMKILK